MGCSNHPVSIVWRCPLDVSAYLALGQQIEVGEHACPGPDCERRRLGGWSGYWRWVRGPGTERLWIRRGRCSRCLRSHALLPDFLLERRLDQVEVIGQALALGIVSGLGIRSVADRGQFLDVLVDCGRHKNAPLTVHSDTSYGASQLRWPSAQRPPQCQP